MQFRGPLTGQELDTFIAAVGGTGEGCMIVFCTTLDGGEPANPRPQAGDPCPNGCAASERWETFRPELLRANEDGEISCPACWEYFGISLGPRS